MGWRPAGDAALLLQAEGLAARLAAAILAERVAGVLDVVPGAGTVLVITEPGSLDLGELAGRLLALPLPPARQAGDDLTEIPVVYDGPDLAEVARLTGLSADEVVARHVAGDYTVGWLGFSPGFGYLTGLDPALTAVPRLAEPRLHVPAGAVAIAGGLAAVYPGASPGGWRLLGRTTAVLWDPDRDPPAVLAPGMRVRFRRADPAAPPPEQSAIRTPPATPPAPASGHPATSTPPPAPAPSHPATSTPPATPAPSHPATSTPPPASATSATPAAQRPGDFHDRGGSVTAAANNPPRSWVGGPAVEVIKPGPLATVQDLGRPGFGHLGVPHSGAADPASLRLANRLAGNPDGTAGIELTFGRAALRFTGDAWVAVTGAPAGVILDAGTGSQDAPESAAGIAAPSEAGPQDAARNEPGGGVAGDVPHGSAFAVPAGGVLRLGAPAAGLRTYVAVRGGIDVPPVLGSRSADLRSGLGPAPLRPGDLLQVGRAVGLPGQAAVGRQPEGAIAESEAARTAAARTGTTVPVLPTPLPAAGEPTVLRVIPGPRDAWFAPGALQQLCAGTYVVTPASDRTGLRLDGQALSSAHGGELPSEGVATGSLQVPPSGRPILLLADHPVTGGYPVIAVVVSEDIGPAGQLRPGSQVRFSFGAR